MSKKKNKLGKFLAFTTTAAAIGGTCYIFRDKIKESSIYKAISSKVSDYFDTFSEKFDDTDDDFFYDEDDDFADVFPENAEHGREYTSITINARDDSKTTDSTFENKVTESNKDSEPAKEEVSSKDNDISSENEKQKESKEDVSSDKEDTIFSNDDLIEIFPKNSISNSSSNKSSSNTDSASKKNPDSTEVNDDENKGLSDVSEDPDTLEEQDKLNF